MDFARIEPIVRASLYEGYALYPYRASAVKNRTRWTFGCLYPHAWSLRGEGDAWQCRADTLLVGEVNATLAIRVRFLQLTQRADTAADSAWQDAVERRVDMPPRSVGELVGRAVEQPFSFRGAANEQRVAEDIHGVLSVSAAPVEAGAFRVSVTIENRTDLAGERLDRDRALLGSLASLHVLFGCAEATFASLVDPPPQLRAAADACESAGLWPVLVGDERRPDMVLASPIFLGDHPKVAPESAGDLFDATEIDEILTLRILTLTDAERAEMSRTDPRARAILDRVEAMDPEALLALHGRWRAPPGIAPGSRVRLRPKGRADAFDLLLDGRDATVSSLEQDVEGRVYVAVTVDDDPGRDLGRMGQPGHRFFFRLEEVELIP
jgi:hypothetical protein